jgi:hypothetical protein
VRTKCVEKSSVGPRAVYGLQKLPHGYRIWYHRRLSWFHGHVCCSCAGMVHMAGVDLEWSYNMAHALALDIRMWPREDIPSLGLTNEDVSLLRD